MKRAARFEPDPEKSLEFIFEKLAQAGWLAAFCHTFVEARNNYNI